MNQSILNQLADLGLDFSSAGEKTFTRGSYFISQGDESVPLYFLKTGMIRHYHAINDNEFTRWISLPGSFVTSLRTFFYGIPSVDYQEAITQCTVLEFSKSQWDSWIASEQRLKDLLIDLLLQDCIGYEDRIASLIGRTVAERYESLSRKNPEWIKQVPLNFLAEIIGTSTRHLRRIRNSHR